MAMTIDRDPIVKVDGSQVDWRDIEISECPEYLKSLWVFPPRLRIVLTLDTGEVIYDLSGRVEVIIKTK